MKILPVVLALALAACAQTPASTVGEAPSFRVAPAWPRPLPEENGVQLVFGQVAGIAVDDRNGHVWVVHRPSTLLADEWDAKRERPVTHRCCKSAPPVVEFDAAGNYLRGWGPSDAQLQWPKSEHGKSLVRSAARGKSEASASRTQLGRPAHMMMDPKSAELYVADGYGNHRV